MDLLRIAARVASSRTAVPSAVNEPVAGPNGPVEVKEGDFVQVMCQDDSVLFAADEFPSIPSTMEELLQMKPDLAGMRPYSIEPVRGVGVRGNDGSWTVVVADHAEAEQWVKDNPEDF